MIRRTCKTFRCPNLHTNVSGYCDSCTRRHAAAYTDGRASSTDRGYNNRWREFSKRFLADHPRCAICGDVSTVTDHKSTPAEIMLDIYGRFDLDPLQYQALCTSCNTRKAAEDRIKVNEYFRKKDLRVQNPGGGSEKTPPHATTAPILTINTHDAFHKGVPGHVEEE